MLSQALAAAPDEDPVAALQAQYTLLKERLVQGPFPEPLYVESIESSHELRGDIYALLDYPIATVRDALASPANWCDALIVHLNVKYCRPVKRDETSVLSLAIGRKTEQALSSAYRLEFAYDVPASQPDYMQVALYARKGPLGTSRYRMTFEALGLENGRAFVHLRYSYAYGFLARTGMRIYLRGKGAGKVGFTTTDDPGNPQPEFIGGFRGIIERNIMRYYLALDAYLGTLEMPVEERFEQSLERWFDATERYPRQLHEVDRETYLAMKRNEYLRQQTAR